MVGLRAIARLSYGTRAAAPGRRTNAAQILRIKKPAVGAPGEGADFPRAKATTARTITELRISMNRRSIRTGKRRSRRRLDPRREQLVHHRRHDPREQRARHQTADDHPGERRVQPAPLQGDREQAADRRQAGEHDREEPHLTGLADRRLEIHPSARSRLVRSTSRMEVLISMPISATNPIVAANERVCPTSSSARTPPATPSGMTDATISVERKVRNSRTRIARIANVATMMAPPTPPKLSWRLSISPAGTIRYPA